MSFELGAMERDADRKGSGLRVLPAATADDEGERANWKRCYVTSFVCRQASVDDAKSSLSA